MSYLRRLVIYWVCFGALGVLGMIWLSAMTLPVQAITALPQEMRIGSKIEVDFIGANTEIDTVTAIADDRSRFAIHCIFGDEWINLSRVYSIKVVQR